MINEYYNKLSSYSNTVCIRMARDLPTVRCARSCCSIAVHSQVTVRGKLDREKSRAARTSATRNRNQDMDIMTDLGCGGRL